MEADRFWGRARATSIDVELLAAVLFMRVLFIKLEFVGGTFIRGYFEKRLNAQPRKKWLWNLHLVLSSLLMMAYIWGAYKYMTPLA